MNSSLHIWEKCKGIWASRNWNQELMPLDISSLSNLYFQYQLHLLSEQSGFVHMAGNMASCRSLPWTSQKGGSHCTDQASSTLITQQEKVVSPSGCQADHPINTTTTFIRW